MIAAAVLLLAAADLAPQVGFYTTTQVEVGAALQLDEDGKFFYHLDYGAVSEAAEGNWSTDGSSVYLTATRMQGAWKARLFDRQPLKIEGDRLLLNRYDTVIRFEREDLPIPAGKSKLEGN